MAAYRDALEWIAREDDTDWVGQDGACLSVTASLVADLFHKTDEQVTKDLRKLIAKQRVYIESVINEE